MCAKNVFRFMCGKCGKKAMTINLGKNEVIIQSPFKETTLHRKTDKIRKALNERNLYALDHWYKLDCYCPECDKIYCGNHMKEEIHFGEGGWYDDATFTCPKKHSRIID